VPRGPAGGSNSAKPGTAARLPVLDRTALDELGANLPPAAARRFAVGYGEMLAGRVDRIISALRHQDADRAMDAVLSLKISSSMVGALAMEERCATLQRHLEAGDTSGARLAAAALPSARDELFTALATFA
jgi:HPt (histidine-containing phosphotransfer) domain-containing protein